MSIENQRFTILSRDGDAPEKYPNVGETFPLKIEERKEGQVSSAEIAFVLADYVAKMGPYAHVIGKINSDSAEALRCEAKYDVQRTFPAGEKIGDLTIKRLVNEL